MTTTQPSKTEERPNRPGDWVETAEGLADIAPGRYNMRIPTDRYVSREIQERERDKIWTKTWQVAGRTSELAEVGDWKVYQLFDQSYILVRGKDDRIRGFVNACRHRGNPLCSGRGNSKRFLCQYHLWSYDLDGKLRGILHEKALGSIDKDENSLLEVSVDTRAGFIFLNPDPNAEPLVDYLGPEVLEMLEPYRLDEMITVMDVRESLECNWKVVVDAFSEGYHIRASTPVVARDHDRIREEQVPAPGAKSVAAHRSKWRTSTSRSRGAGRGHPRTARDVSVPAAYLAAIRGTGRRVPRRRRATRVPRRSHRAYRPAAGHTRDPHGNGSGRERPDRRPDERQSRMGAVPQLLHDDSCR